MRAQQGFARFLELAVCLLQLSMGGLKFRYEPLFAFAEQCHVISLLLHAPGGVALGGHIQQQNPHAFRVGMQMNVGRSAGRHLHGMNKERRLAQRQKTFQKQDLAAGRVAELDIGEAVTT